MSSGCVGFVNVCGCWLDGWSGKCSVSFVNILANVAKAFVCLPGFLASNPCNFLTAPSKSLATLVAKDLLEAIRKLQGLEARNPGRHTTALAELAKIFTNKTEHLPDHPSSQQPQTLTNPTQPEDIRQTPRVHKRKTRNNTPGIIPNQIKNIPPISEGDPVPTPVGASEQWYSEPREKRQRIRQERKKVPTRRSPRLNKSINSPVESASKYCFETRDKDQEAVQKDTKQTFGLGVPRVAIPLEMEDYPLRFKIATGSR